MFNWIKKTAQVHTPLELLLHEFCRYLSMNTIQNDRQMKQYRKKYKYMKMRIKSLILENAALCDEVAKVQESILIVKDERRFLLHKLLEYENDVEPQILFKNDGVITSNGSRSKIKKRQSCDDTK